MKTIFDAEVRAEIEGRIDKLTSKCTAQWGKMGVFQMIKHCSLWDETMLSGKKNKRPLISYIFGKLALKSVLRDNSPLRKNTPTTPELIIKESEGDVENEKSKWISHIRSYKDFPQQEYIHPFFGKMKRDEIGKLAYKHADHHLRQFNC